MRKSPTTHRVLVVSAILAMLSLNACAPDASTSPSPKANEPSAIDPSSILTVLSCNADVGARRIACGQLGTNALNVPASSVGDGEMAHLILGGQAVFVNVQTSNVDYDPGTGSFTFDATIRNLIPQPLGTADTIPDPLDPDPSGIRIFVAGGPTVTAGTGTITLPSPDGMDAFTGANQPYYQYNTVLEQYEISSAKKWTLNMPNTVETFTFALLVSAAVPRPDGYIDLQVSNNSVKPPTDKPVSYFVRNANGTLAGDQGISMWLSSDTTRATVNSSGIINPLRAGSVIVTAISADGLRVGYLPVTVEPTKRTWTGAVSTNWHAGGNWAPDGVIPEPVDSVVIPDALTLYPTLAQNTFIAGIEVVGPGGTINVGAFDLEATGNIDMPALGDITGSSGRLILSGFSNTVNGFSPRIIVPASGRYSLSGNLTVTGRVRADAGRLRNGAFRLRVNG